MRWACHRLRDLIKTALVTRVLAGGRSTDCERKLGGRDAAGDHRRRGRDVPCVVCVRRRFGDRSSCAWCGPRVDTMTKEHPGGFRVEIEDTSKASLFCVPPIPCAPLSWPRPLPCIVQRSRFRTLATIAILLPNCDYDRALKTAAERACQTTAVTLTTSAAPLELTHECRQQEATNGDIVRRTYRCMN